MFIYHYSGWKILEKIPNVLPTSRYILVYDSMLISDWFSNSDFFHKRCQYGHNPQYLQKSVNWKFSKNSQMYYKRLYVSWCTKFAQILVQILSKYFFTMLYETMVFDYEYLLYQWMENFEKNTICTSYLPLHFGVRLVAELWLVREQWFFHERCQCGHSPQFLQKAVRWKFSKNSQKYCIALPWLNFVPNFE